ncbi:YcaO-like family protein [Spirillospora sp. NPDC050679]
MNASTWERALELPSPKTAPDGGGRAVTARETLSRAAPAARAARITRVAAIGGLDRIGVPVFCAFRPASRNLAVSQGKGADADAARASAVMEAIELWHAERHRLPLRYSTTEALLGSGERVADVPGLVKCPCHEYTPTRPLRWTRGFDLFARAPAWVPYEAVHCDWRLPTPPGEHSFQNGSNGLASGNTLVEAIVHGLCEVIERDCLIAFDRLPEEVSVRRRVDPATVGDPVCLDLLERFAAAGIELAIWDMTAGIGVPTYTCVAIEVDAPWYRPLPQTQGSGTHPVRAVALRRAITEAAQARAAIIGGARDDIFPERYAYYFDAAERDRLALETAIPAARRFADTEEAVHDTANADLAWLLERLAAAGRREAVVVDLTDPRFGLPVVKVIVPGLEWRPWED